MLRITITDLIKKTLISLQKEKKLPCFKIPDISVQKPVLQSHGDYSSNVALKIARGVGKSPAEIAKVIAQEMNKLEIFQEVGVAEPCFINFFLSNKTLYSQLKEILQKKEAFGSLELGQGKKVNLEFISANPTGPLHIGNCRGGFCGDVLANVLKKAGYEVFREYYVNDRGVQVREVLRRSLEGKEGGYKGAYIEDLRKRKIKDPEVAAHIILKEQIKPTIEKMKIKFDCYFFESDLYRKKETDKALNFLKKQGFVYEKEGALWFRTTDLGDDKDRVLIKSDGQATYFLSDIAYLKNKFNRGFDYLIFFWGAEHHGYIKRIKAATKALGFSEERVIPLIVQLVKLVEKGKEVKMSKRAGKYITVDELINEVGVDVARFFFLQRSYDKHLLFDLDLAREQSQKNPVYYIQYAFARISSVLKKAQIKETQVKCSQKELELLKEKEELSLIKKLLRLPEIVEDIACDYQVHRIAHYALDLAEGFHCFYQKHRILSEDKRLEKARLALVLATRIVLKNTLDLMGISAPERM